MVLGSENQSAEAGVLRRADNLIGVKVGGVEDRLRFVAEAPFAIGERVDRKVHEREGRILLRDALALGGQRAVGRGRGCRAPRHRGGGDKREKVTAPAKHT